MLPFYRLLLNANNLFRKGGKTEINALCSSRYLGVVEKSVAFGGASVLRRGHAVHSAHAHCYNVNAYNKEHEIVSWNATL